MCVICVLQPGYTPPFEMIKNAAHNNWHGYGMLLKENKRIQVIKKCEPTGENDPQEIYDILKKHEDIERVLHVRHTTMGTTSMENTQPFPVFYSKNRQIYFCHNGTLGIDPPTARQLDALGDHDITTDSSDSKKFATFKLAPLLQRMVGENGKGDIHDPFFMELVGKLWSNNNRGIIYANDQEPLYLGANWRTIKDKDGNEFFASNDDYFNRVQRGPEHERRMAEQRKKNTAITNERRGNDTDRVSNAFQLQCPTFRIRYGLSEGIKNILEDDDVWDLDGYISMANLTLKETEELVESLGTDLAAMLMYITGELKKEHYMRLNGEHNLEQAGKRISALIKTVRESEKTITLQKEKLVQTGGFGADEVHVG